jgi:Molecular chaperone GrpE (heat shock protein)
MDEKENINEPGETSPDKELYVRLLADFQNYKRRIEKERMGWMVDAQIDVLRPLVGIMDDMSRAVTACTGNEGLVLLQKSIEKSFKDLGVVEIDCSGKFNPEFHEALIEVESPGHTAGDIVEVHGKGYVFQPTEQVSYVLRHAKVSVAK